MSITNLTTGESVGMQYNPTEVEEVLAVTYAKQTVPGMSHKVHQYTNTENLGLTFDLAFDALANPKSFDVFSCGLARSFLHALCYPRRGATTVRAGAPDRALFMWPNLYTLTSVIINLRIRHTRFALDGSPTAFVASLTIDEIRDMRLTAEDVEAAYGTIRGPTGGDQ